ncbi:MAG TPA: response regulator [Bryobacteraceae bacterium]|nr:response regulator [Bryobacteraceae bacterium]
MTRDPNQLSLLLVEDSPADVFLVREVMREEGFDCVLNVAEDGEKAIQIIDGLDENSAAAPPDVALLDMNVPRVSGSEVLQRIRSSRSCARIPVVMISSTDCPEERKLTLDLGATEFFRKPSNLAGFMELGKLVRRLRARHSETAA